MTTSTVSSEVEGITKAGEVKIEKLLLLTQGNGVIDLIEFLVEINLYEDMFSNFMQGNIVLTDSRNLIQKFNIRGEESLIVSFRTPTFESIHTIKKTFTTYKLTDRVVVRDNNTQNFVLHFVSSEAYIDMLLPIFKGFEGPITQDEGEGDQRSVVRKIFEDYISINTNYDVSLESRKVEEKPDLSPLLILNDASNKVKFVSPGWTPFKCINWLASKSLPKDGIAANFLFFETNKSFVFGSVEHILKEAVQNETSLGTYTIAASNISRDGQASNDVNREMFLAKDVEMTDSHDQIKNLNSGYYASRLVYLDIYSKIYEDIEYDYIGEYKKQFHTSGSGPTSIPPFNDLTPRNSSAHISFYPKNPRLFQNSSSDWFKDNISEKMGTIYSNRKSSLMDINNIKMNITVPGRTDIEVGRILYFLYPSLNAKEEKDSSVPDQDTLYSGYYLITSIHHKINRHQHMMTMEIVKDSLYIDKNTIN